MKLFRYTGSRIGKLIASKFQFLVGKQISNAEHLREVGWGDIDRIDLVQNSEKLRAVVNAVMNLRVS